MTAARYFLLLTCLSAPSAFGESKKLDVCPEAKEFTQQVYNCGTNDLPVKLAQQCSDYVMNKSKAQGAAFALVLNSMRAKLGSAQNLSMTDTAARLGLAITQFTTQIQELQDQTAKVANYTESMIDFADGKDDDTSLDCFSSNFHALQKIVDGLDQQIENSMDARLAALKMLATVKAQGVKLDADPKSSLTKVPNAKNGGQSYPKATNGTPKPRGLTGDDPYRPSDISGTEKIKK